MDPYDGWAAVAPCNVPHNTMPVLDSRLQRCHKKWPFMSPLFQGFYQYSICSSGLDIGCFIQLTGVGLVWNKIDSKCSGAVQRVRGA